MKKFTNFKVKTWELVVICIILASVVLLPDWLVQLNQTLIGKGLLLVALVTASLHKPYMGLLVLLLIVSLGYYREGADNPACSIYETTGECSQHNCKWTGNSCEASEQPAASQPPGSGPHDATNDAAHAKQMQAANVEANAVP